MQANRIIEELSMNTSTTKASKQQKTDKFQEVLRDSSKDFSGNTTEKNADERTIGNCSRAADNKDISSVVIKKIQDNNKIDEFDFSIYKNNNTIVISEIEQAIQDIQKKIAEYTGKSVEEIKEILKNSNINEQELFDNGKICELLGQLFNKSDPMELITDNQLSITIKELFNEISAIKENLIDTTGMNLELIKDIANENFMKNIQNNLDVSSDKYELSDKNNSQSVNVKVNNGEESITADTNLNAENGKFLEQSAVSNISETDVKEIIKMQMGISDENQSLENGAEIIDDESANFTLNQKVLNEKLMSNVETNELNAKLEPINKNSYNSISSSNENLQDTASEQFNNSQDSSSKDQQNAGMNFINGMDIINNIKSAIINSKSEFVDSPVADRILNQIVNQIKLYAKPDMTSLTMQLEPENLGKVSISIASKAGMIVAQIGAQNMVAKEAIESQINVLKDNLNSQGVKVEDIEVVIESHGFEENLNKGNETKDNPQKQKNKNISKKELNMIYGEQSEDEELSESLEKQAMEQRGNTVSYTA